MTEQFSRTALLFGEEGMERLFRARVAVFGIGGVGGHAMEALARSGIGQLDLIDNDTVSVSNLNRQLIATQQTIGQRKVDAAEVRIHEINPDCMVRKFPVFFTPETAEQFDFSVYDYVVDAIDTVAGKIALVMQAQAAGVPVISSMGAGNKMDPTKLAVADISKTSVCRLARVMRRELRKRNVQHLKVVYSTEQAVQIKSSVKAENDGEGMQSGTTTGSNAFVPAAAGLILAAEVVKELSGWKAEI